MITTQKMTGGEAVLRAAVANGIDTVFGIPGAQIYPLFDAIYRMPAVSAVVTRHEQGAAYMAFGAAQATGRPAAFAVVPGPGVLNTSAALCTAAGCNQPVLCLTGQVPSKFLGKGRGHLHELRDQAGTLRTIIKHADHIADPARAFQQTNDAFRIMQSGRPGPVSLEMCWDTMAREWEVTSGPGNETIDTPALDEDALNDAADLIAKSKNIMIMCGGGAQHASAEVTALAELLGAPATAFRMGRGVVGEDHPCGISAAAGMQLWQDTDLLIGIGSRLELQYMRWMGMGSFHDHPPADGARVIRIDIDPAEMQRFRPDVGIVADSAEAVSALVEKITARGFRAGDRERIANAKSAARKNIEEIQPQIAYLDAIRDVLPRDGRFVGELCQVGFASYFGFEVFEPRTYISEGFQGTLGFGFPTALGVKAALPDKAVVSVTGDGGFMFGVQELATAVQHDIGLVTIVFNNSSYGNVRRDQQQRFDANLIGADLVNPDFMKFAESFGVMGHRVHSPAEMRGALERAIDDDAPSLIEVVIERGSEASPWKYIMR